MPGDNILVIAVDGLRATALGGYGNTSYPTPALDQFAAESFLLDSCFADAVELKQIYDALWCSVHPLKRGPNELAECAALPRILRDRGYSTTLLTDEPAIARIAGNNAFDEVVQLAEANPVRAEDVGQTSFARLFTATCDELQKPSSCRFVWVHSRGHYGAWDAPLELQEPLLEHAEGDPPPIESIIPPEIELDESNDPDTVFRWNCAYAAQVMALDTCVAALSEALANLSSDRWLVVLLGVRGFPLGEHGRIGGVDGRLYVEQLHVPMLWRFPDGTGRLMRNNRLTSHLDFLPTVLDWADVEAKQELSRITGKSLLPQAKLGEDVARDCLVAASAVAQSIRTEDWTLRCDTVPTASTDAATELRPELFVRPDDRWEANDVATLCPEEVEDLTRRLEERNASVTTGEQIG